MPEDRVANPRIITTVLPCGTQVVAYRLKGARTSCVVLRAGSWDAVFAEVAPEWMAPFKAVSGHLIEHATGSAIQGTDTEGLGGLWRGQSVEWTMEGTPGELRRMLGVLSRVCAAGTAITQEILAAEWSRVQLEGRHRRNAGVDGGQVNLVQRLLVDDLPAPADACGTDLDADPDTIAAWLRQLPAVAEAWLRPERSLLVIVGPEDPRQSVEYAQQAFRHYPPRVSMPECLGGTSNPPAPRTIRHQYSGDKPIPTIYAWGTPYLEAYRGALSLLRHAAHYEAMRRGGAAGLAYWIAVGPAAHHLWGAVWCSPERVDEALAILRQAFFNTLERLSDPSILTELKKQRARFQFRESVGFSRAAASGYAWLRRLYPDARDPFSAHLRSIMGVNVDDMHQLREQYADESLVTTVEYRPD
jgi:hypothetical protein